MEENLKNQSPYELAIRIRMKINGSVVYGSGISTLLQRTDELGSLHAAAKEIGMPYKKALFIVKRAEDELSKKLLERTIGGKKGGGSKLTEFGHYFVYQFKVIEEEVENYTSKLMETYFPIDSTKSLT